ncbi:hypothetical protein C8R46DRAFT_1187363 [Mycena filopes]|nr:hypothetical protein C8R46DRAFT_1187363 [Mycena filopes]
MVWDTGFVDTLSANLVVEKYPRARPQHNRRRPAVGAPFHAVFADEGKPFRLIRPPAAASSASLGLVHGCAALSRWRTRFFEGDGEARGRECFLKYFLGQERGGGEGGAGGQAVMSWSTLVVPVFSHAKDSRSFTSWGRGPDTVYLAKDDMLGLERASAGWTMCLRPFTRVARSRPHVDAEQRVAPPTDQATFHQWSVGSLYYWALVMAEGNYRTLGPHAGYELRRRQPVVGHAHLRHLRERDAIVNYLDDDSTGTADAVIAIAGATIPSSVKVKYLAATLVVQKGGYAWAEQTFGSFFESDGRPTGIQTENITTVQRARAGLCARVPNDNVFTEDKGYMPSVTFATTAATRTHNTATVDPTVFATSNGNGMSDHDLAGTSKPPSVAPRMASASVIAAAVVVGAVVAVLGRVMLDSEATQTAEGDDSDCLLHTYILKDASIPGQ